MHDLVRCLTEFDEPIHRVGPEAGTLTQQAGFGVICLEARQGAVQRVGVKVDPAWAPERRLSKIVDLCYEGGGGFRDDSR